MARIRTIKPELWSSDRFGECSTSARLMFVASLNFADDAGNLDRSARQLKAQTLPYDNVEPEPLIAELLRSGLFIEYKVLDKLYLHIKNFELHQKIDRPSKSRLPLYDSSMRTQLRTQRQLIEPSTSPRQNNPAEGKGMEGIMEGNGREKEGMQGEKISAPRSARIDPMFGMTPERREYAEKHGLNPIGVMEAFVDYWTAAPGERGRKNDWDATWRTWCRKEASQAKPASTKPTNLDHDSLEWREATHLAEAIGFRKPWPMESAGSYLTAVKFETNKPMAREVKERMAALTNRMRMPT
jgi:hypothetical protein